MILLFDITTLENHKATEKLPLKCEYCGNVFYNVKKEIKKVLNNHRAVKLKYCSVNCRYKSSDTRILINCKQCNKQFKRQKSEIIKNNFCSKSCSGTYNNTHKTKGYRRSKLEKYIEIELIKLYPNLKILFNDNKVINSELDIYMPSLKLAFELNGIFHYEQIFTQEKFFRTQNNDKRKFQACVEQDIELCVIDTSQQKYFKELSSQKYLLIITTIINKKIGCLMEDDSTST